MQSLRKYGDAFSIIISSLFFALVHQHYLQMLYAFICGITIGFFVIRTGSLATGIYMHFSINLFSVILNILSCRIGGISQDIIINFISIIILVFSLASFFYLILKYNNSFILNTKSSNLSLIEKIQSVFFNPITIITILAFILSSYKTFIFIGL